MGSEMFGLFLRVSEGCGVMSGPSASNLLRLPGAWISKNGKVPSEHHQSVRDEKYVIT